MINLCTNVNLNVRLNSRLLMIPWLVDTCKMSCHVNAEMIPLPFLQKILKIDGQCTACIAATL